MIEALKALKDTPLPTILAIGGILFLFLASVRKFGVGSSIEIEPDKRWLVGLLGTILLCSGIGLYLMPAVQKPGDIFPTDTPNAVSSTQVVRPTSTAQPSVVQTQVVQPTSIVQQSVVPTNTLPSVKIPQTPDEAANLFGGPPSSQWQTCPQETNCWMFKLPNNSFRISVPENCLNQNGSIDGWRYKGGYPGEPNNFEGTTSIWNSLEAAVIRCR